MFTQAVYAQQAGTFTQDAYGLEEIIVVGVAILIFVSVILTIVFMLTGGFFLILSGGKEEKVKPAISMIRYAVIGLIVIILVVLLTPFLTRAIGIGSIGNLFSPKEIFSTMGCVKDRLLGDFNRSCISSISTSSGGNSFNGSGGSSFTDI